MAAGMGAPAAAPFRSAVGLPYLDGPRRLHADRRPGACLEIGTAFGASLAP